MAGRVLHPLGAHALIERRAVLRGALASAALIAAGCTTKGKRASTSAASASAYVPKPYDPAQPYWLQGNYAPVPDELATTNLEVTGALPPSLSGLFVRNGSNPANGKSSHWFLGDGMVHGVRLEKGKAVWYRNKWVDTPLLHAQGDILSGGDLVPGKHVTPANTSMTTIDGRLLALCEVGWPYEVSPTDLSTIGPYDFGGRLATAMTAHPKTDPATGNVHFFGYGFVPPYLTYHVVDPRGVLVHSEEIAVPGPTMVHDFAITDRDVVFWDLPVVFDLDLALAKQMPFRWDPAYGSRVGVMPLGGPASAMRWVDIDSCYVFHGTNAFRDGDNVVVDVSRLPTMFAEGGDIGTNDVRRWTVNTAGPQMTWREDVTIDRPFDLPTIDRRVAGRQQRYAWYTTTRPWGDAFEFAGVIRHDFRTAVDDVWEPDAAESAGEGLYVAEGEEGHGWVLTFVYDRRRDTSDLAVLDASAVSKGPIARVHLPRRVPYGFHATWVPTESA